MFEYCPVKLDSLVSKFHESVAAEFGTKGASAFVMPALIAKLFGDTDNPNTIGWALDHYYAAKMAPMIPALAKLYDALEANGHTTENDYDIGSCDRRVAYIPYGNKGAKVMAFCNQNVSYVVVLVPARAFTPTHQEIKTYALHIRIVTPGRESMDITACDFNVNYEKMLPGCDSDRYDANGSDYFRYQDMRDRGYVMTLTPEIVSRHSEVFHKTEGMYNSHPSGRYVMDELDAYCSMMEETLEELNEKA
jgi:hypothetical protein